MLTNLRNACPYCLLALVGLTLLICIPGMASQTTPVGQLGLWMLWVPILSAALRAGLLRMARVR